MKDQSFKNNHYAIWRGFSKNRKIQIFLLLFLIGISSICEGLSIGSLYPLLEIFINGNLGNTESELLKIYSYFGISSIDNSRKDWLILFVILTCLSAIIKFTVLSFQIFISNKIGADLSVGIYRNVLHQPYQLHTLENSSVLISGITSKVNLLIQEVVYPYFNLATALCSIVLISVSTYFVDAKVTVVALLALFFIYGLIILRTRNILKQNSKFIDSYLDNSIKILRESFGGIREIIIDQTQGVFVKIYQNIEWSMRQAKIRTQVIGASPRFVIEVGCVISLLIIFLGLDHLNESINLNIPFLGVLAFAFQRAFPVMQTGFSSWTQIRGSSEVSREVANLYIRRSKYFEHKRNEKISFKREILLDDISFSYPGSSKLTLKSVTLKIKKGSRVGIKGETGSGKTTLIDLLIGLFNPTKGRLLVDGVELSSENRNSWFSHIVHVPQNVYIADSTIAENIAFGVKLEDIDFARLESSIANSQLSNFVESLPNKYYTVVGEKGAFLSGGQIQRLGIARALYKNAELLVFDESTSALDTKTESNLMDSINTLDDALTIIVIAHRQSALLECDEIYKIVNGELMLC